MKRLGWLLLGAVLLVSTGCTTLQRPLLLTEVGKDKVELYLAEPASERLRLGDGFHLEVRSSVNGTVSRSVVGLGAAGPTMAGGTFLMVWEGNGYSGPPVAEDYPSGQNGTVPGIKVRDGFFGNIDGKPSEVRVVGERNRVTGVLVIFPMATTDVVDDVLRFGQPQEDRPDSGGNFAANGSLLYPTGSGPLQRRWGTGGPVDSDREEDWMWGASSWGAPTP